MKRIKRLLVLGVFLGGLLAGWAAAAQDAYSVLGRISATDQEAQEGYFALDDQTMIVVKPGSDLHTFLRRRVGQPLRLTLEPGRPSE